MARNFWFDAFTADKADTTVLPAITKAERIANLKNGIERFKARISAASSSADADRLRAGLAIRERNLSALLSA